MPEDILISNLTRPVTFFKVGDEIKDTAFPPGTLGFISDIEGVDGVFQNVAKMRTVVIRKGKGGKNRLMRLQVKTPIFFLNDETFQKILPKPGTVRYFANVKPQPLEQDIFKLSSVKFLGFMTATADRIKRLSDRCRHKKWPEQKSHPVNVGRKLPDYFSDDPEYTIDKYCNAGFKEVFAKECNKMLASLTKVVVEKEFDVITTMASAASFLLFTNKGEFLDKGEKNEYQFMPNNKVLNLTLEHYKALWEEAANLHAKKGGKVSPLDL